MTDTKKSRVINGVHVTKLGWGKYECDFGVDEFGDPMIAVLRKPDIASIVMTAGQEDIPNVFRQQVVDMLSGKQTATAVGVNSLTDETQAQDALREQDLPKINRMIQMVVDAAFSADPRYNAEGTEGFTFADLPMQIKLWTFAWSMPREVAALSSFPDDGQPADMGPAPDGEELRSEAVGAAENTQ